MSWALSVWSACALALSAAYSVVAASVSDSIRPRRLILPVSNSLSFWAAKPSMAILLEASAFSGRAAFRKTDLAPECVFLDDVGELDVVVERVEHMEAAVAAAGYLLTFRLYRRANARLVPIGKRVAIVIDIGLRRRSVVGGGVRSEEHTSELQ